MVALVFNIADNYRKSMNTGGALNIQGMSTLKMMIVANTFTETQNTVTLVSTVTTGPSAHEVSGTGYTAGGNACLNGTVTMDAAGLITVDCADPATWAQSATGFSNGRYAVLYDTVTSKVIGVSAAFGGATPADKGNVAGAFSIAIGTGAIYTMPRPV